MVLTSVDCARNSRLAGLLQSRPWPMLTQVRLRLRALSSSMVFDRSVERKAPDRIDIRMAGHLRGKLGMRAGQDVDDACRHVRGFEHLIEIGGAQRDRARRPPARRGCPSPSPGAITETRPSSGLSSAQNAPITPTGSFIAKRDAAHRHGLGRTVILVGPGRPGNSRVDAAQRPRPRPTCRRVSRGDAGGKFVGAGRQVLADVIEDLRPGMRRSTCPSPSRPARPRPRCAGPCGWRERHGPAACPSRDQTARE